MNKLCAISDLQHVSLQAKLKAYQACVNQKNYLVIEKSGALYLYRDRCPHQQKTLTNTLAKLFDESLSLIHCEHHHALFTIDQGLCIRGPCKEASLEKVDFEIREGWVCIT